MGVTMLEVLEDKLEVDDEVGVLEVEVELKVVDVGVNMLDVLEVEAELEVVEVVVGLVEVFDVVEVELADVLVVVEHIGAV